MSKFKEIRVKSQILYVDDERDKVQRQNFDVKVHRQSSVVKARNFEVRVQKRNRSVVKIFEIKLKHTTTTILAPFFPWDFLILCNQVCSYWLEVNKLSKINCKK